MNSVRQYKIIIGSKKFFDEKVNEDTTDDSSIKSFIELVRLSDEKRNNGKSLSDIDKANILVLKNDHYHGIVETAHDRLGSLIEEVSSDCAIIYIHNPPMKLYNHLHNLESRNLITLVESKENYDIERKPESFKECIELISKKIIGQGDAVLELSKSLWYLTKAKRRNPYVVMLYGDSSLGKSEIVREVSKNFFNSKFVEKHLSMFKNDAYSYYFFGNQPNRTSLGFDLLERESNLVFLDELDKCPEHFFSSFYTLFDNIEFQDATYKVDISGLFIVLTSNYQTLKEMEKKLGLPIYYRIDKFIKFKKFTKDTILEITMNEIKKLVQECNGILNEEEIFISVSSNIKITDENARTIKNKVLAVFEELLFEKLLNKE